MFIVEKLTYITTDDGAKEEQWSPIFGEQNFNSVSDSADESTSLGGKLVSFQQFGGTREARLNLSASDLGGSGTCRVCVQHIARSTGSSKKVLISVPSEYLDIGEGASGGEVLFPPDPPTNLRAELISSNQVNVSWTEVPGITSDNGSYTIRYSKFSYPMIENVSTEISGLHGSKTQIEISDAGYNYYFQIRAEKGGKYSSWVPEDPLLVSVGKNLTFLIFGQ